MDLDKRLLFIPIIIVIIILYIYLSKEVKINDGLYGQWKAEQTFCNKMDIQNMSLFIGKSGNPRKAVLIINDKTLTLSIKFKSETTCKGGYKYTTDFKFKNSKTKLFKDNSILMYSQVDNMITISKNKKVYAELFKDAAMSKYAKENASNPEQFSDNIEYGNFGDEFRPEMFDAEGAQDTHTDYVRKGGMSTAATSTGLWESVANGEIDLVNRFENLAAESSNTISEAMTSDNISSAINDSQNIRAARNERHQRETKQSNPIKDNDFNDLINDFNNGDFASGGGNGGGGCHDDEDVIM